VLEIDINNKRTMQVHQDKLYRKIQVLTGKNSIINGIIDIDDNFNISEGDFVMLINYYRYIKDNNIKCDFINPYGGGENAV